MQNPLLGSVIDALLLECKATGPFAIPLLAGPLRLPNRLPPPLRPNGRSIPSPQHGGPADRGVDVPVSPLPAPGHLAVAKDMYPAEAGVLDAAHVLETFSTRLMRHHRIREMAPGALPFRVLALQPARTCRVRMFQSRWFHGTPL